MSKKRFGLSMLTALAMVLMFSVTALAAGVITLKANVENGFVKATWAADADAAVTGYTVKVLDGTTVLDTQTVTEAKYTSVVTVTESKKYKVEVMTNGGANNTNTSFVEIWAPASNNVLASTDKDNNLGNANQTGNGITKNDGSTNTTVIKSSDVKNDGTTGTQRTHGEYQNNTNSCASCHQTHTGASKSLLFKDGVYNTCTACHDGTLGFYNVFESSNAGTFGGTHDGNMSVHLADGTVQVKAAPGGNLSANSGSWINEFNCASCHAPHGSYSERLLHYNPNGMGLAKTSDGGIGVKDGTIYEFASLPSAAAADAAKFILVRGTATQVGLLAADIDGGDPATTKVIMVYEDKGSAYAKSSTPWLYGYAYGNPNKSYFTRFWVTVANTAVAAPDNTIITEADGTKHFQGVVDSHDQDWNANLKIEWSKGFIYATNGDTILDNLTKGDVGRAYTVDLDLEEIARFGDANGVPIYTSNVNTLFDSAAVGYVSGKGVAMSTYCASCHVDYLAKSGSATGTFSSAYRHTTTSDSYTCVRCHYSHGTDVEVMMDAHGETVTDLTATGGAFVGDTTKATAYMLDKNPSSALKRYTNMSVCWGCHTDSKAEQLKNTFSFGDNDGQTDPHGLTPQPAMPGAIGTNNIFAPLP